MFGEIYSESKVETGNEAFTQAQQDKIIRLEMRIAPRALNKDEQSSIDAVLEKFPKPLFDICITPGIEDVFVRELTETLKAAGWSVRSFGGPAANPEQLLVPEGSVPGIGICATTGVRIWIDLSIKEQFERSAGALESLLKKLGIEASAFVMEDNTKHSRPEIVHIQIGSRL